MIDAVHGYTYFSEPIAFEMDDGDIKETIRPYAMGRIIDIESFYRIIHVIRMAEHCILNLKLRIICFRGTIAVFGSVFRWNMYADR